MLGFKATMYVVYLDQRAHLCACICMVKNKEKCLKIIKNMFFFMRLRDTLTHDDKWLKWASLDHKNVTTISVCLRYKMAETFTGDPTHGQQSSCQLF